MNNLMVTFDEFISAMAKSGMFSGSVLVAMKGTVILNNGYGRANYELDVPNMSNTVFRIGSITKQFTLLAVLQLCEKGLVKLDDTLDKFISGYPKGDEVTIHHLLSHTSGITNYTSKPDHMEEARKRHSVDELIETFKHSTFDFLPGERFEYSNSGYVLLGKIIETVTGKSYEEYLKKNIFDPLEMHHSGYDHEEDIIKFRASGYTRSEEGVLKNADYLDMSVPYAAGGLYSTVEDLYKWDQALYTDRLITKESLSKIFHPYSDSGYGYGWVIQTIQSRKVIWHNGGVPGFSSFILRSVDDGASIIVLSNVMPNPADHLGWRLGEIMLSKINM